MRIVTMIGRQAYFVVQTLQLLCIVAGLGLTLGCASSSKVPVRENRAELRDAPYVILVSIDGYRYDYTQLYAPPLLKEFSQNGAQGELIPVFPSKTFTNHYSIVTGLYPEKHGIVANSFYDPGRKERYRLSDRSKVRDGSWYFGEPIWVAAEKQGLLSATYFWPGSEADIQGVRPTYFMVYDDSISHEKRIAQVQKWLELPPAVRPHFITLYFSEVDTAGHHFGPHSKEVRDAVLKVDQTLSNLLEVIRMEKLPINLFIVSDHGMQQIDPEKAVYVDDIIQVKDIQVEGRGPQMMIYVSDPLKLEQIFLALKTAGKKKHFTVYKKSQMPAKYHFSLSPRIGDLVLIPEAPYSLVFRNENSKMEPGNHGYDPDVTKTMHAIFYAQGPQIQEKQSLKPFRNVHIYPFVLKVLGLQAPESDGDVKVLERIYR